MTTRLRYAFIVLTASIAVTLEVVLMTEAPTDLAAGGILLLAFFSGGAIALLLPPERDEVSERIARAIRRTQQMKTP